MKKVILVALLVAIMPVQFSFAATDSNADLIAEIQAKIDSYKTELVALMAQLPEQKASVGLYVDEEPIMTEAMEATPIVALTLCELYAYNATNVNESIYCMFGNEVFYRGNY